jgi:outer membrane protein assembly factor BamC
MKHLTPVLFAAALATAGCSTVEGFLAGDKIDYRSAAGKTNPLEVPPDLTQLARDGRYQPQASGTVSASALQSAAPVAATTAATAIAPTAIANVRLQRDGQQRWLQVPVAADPLWPQLRSFWEENGFTVVVDNASAGVMETDWAENRAKIPSDFIRNTVGRVLDSLYSTGERDKFRTRVERRPDGGSDIYLTHRRMEEVFVSPQQDRTMWTARPADPQLEAEFLSRLLVKLGAKEEAARATVAAATPTTTTAGSTPTQAAAAPRARLLPGAASLQVDEGFDRAWRRVGLALDRTGFTVEDRDRANGLYYLRYADPRRAGSDDDEPGFLARLFSFGRAGNSNAGAPARYRVALKTEGERTTVTVQNPQGAPESGEIAQRIVALLVDDLK